MNDFKEGEYVLIIGKVVSVTPDPDYGLDSDFNHPHMYELEFNPEFDTVTFRGTMIDKMK